MEDVSGMSEPQAREIITDASNYRDLTAWEVSFLRDMSQRDWPFTEKQVAAIRRIERKIYRTG